MAGHLVTTIAPLILTTSMVWTHPLVPTLEGQYILKNALLFALGVSLFSRLEPILLVTGSYRLFRPYLRRDFRQCCAYCLLHEFWAGGESNFEIDHFRPVSKFPELKREYSNLCYACHVCNFYKWDHWPSSDLEAQGIGFVDLCTSEFDQHYLLQSDGFLEPLTLAANYTLTLLHLNSSHLIALRRFSLRQGWSISAPPETV